MATNRLGDLLSLIKDDLHLIALAFVFLLGAAVAQVLIPHYTGEPHKITLFQVLKKERKRVCR
jgi:hypothetical protein